MLPAFLLGAGEVGVGGLWARVLLGVLAAGLAVSMDAQDAQDVAAVAAGGQTRLAALRRLVDTGHASEALAQGRALAAEPGVTPGEREGLHRTAGLAYYALGQMEAARGEFAQALALASGDREAAEMEGLTLVRLGRPAEAIPLLEGVRGAPGAQVKADPEYVLARCYVEVGRYEEARRAFAAQFGLEPDGAPAYLLTGRMLLRSERLPAARTAAEKAVALDPRLPLAHGLLGEVLLAQGEVAGAIAELERERAANPLEPTTYDRLGDAYGRAGQNEKARLVLQEAVVLGPQATGPYILLGKTLLREGDAVGAQGYLAHAEGMDPGNAVTHSLLGQAYRAMGRREEAGRETAEAGRLQGGGIKLEEVH